NTLGPTGLPVYNTGLSDGPGLLDVSATGELTWWTPGANVTSTGTTTLTLPVLQNMFAPNGTGTSDANRFQTAILTGNLVVSQQQETVTFHLESDDDAFLAIDNAVIGQVGGVHPLAGGNFSTVLNAGTYALSIFYADRHQEEAKLDFSVITPDVSINAPVPG